MRAIFTVVGVFLLPFLSNLYCESHDTSSMHMIHHKLLTGTIPNMLMKRFVGGGDDWCIHVDVMVMVFQWCPLINLQASPSARPLSQPHSSGIMNTTIKSRLITWVASGCWITRGGGVMDSARQAGWRTTQQEGGLGDGARGSINYFSKKKMPQMPFLELYHVYIYYMTSHYQFCWKIPPTAIVMRLTIASLCFLLVTD